jgi:hypothetical protein
MGSNASLGGEPDRETVRIAARERVERLELEAGDWGRSPESIRRWMKAEIRLEIERTVGQHGCMSR